MEKKNVFVELTEVRKGEIALILLKEKFIREAQKLNRTDVMENINEAAEMFKGVISKEELISLYKELIEDAVKKIF